MNFLQKISIKYKILIVILLVAFITSGVGFIVLSTTIVSSYKNDLIEQVRSDALFVGEQMVTAIEFNDKKGGLETLAKLKGTSEIEHCLVFNAQNKNFLSYDTKSEIIIPPKDLSQRQFWFDNDKLLMVEPIIYQNENFGALFIIVSTKELSNKINNFTLITLLVFLGLSLFSVFLAQLFQRVISKPILDLSIAAQKIGENHDYSLRLKKTTNDEIGELYDKFNTMISDIGMREIERDKALTQLEENKERLQKMAYSAFDGILLVSSDGTINFWNKAAAEIFGYNDEEAYSRPIYTLFETVFKNKLKTELAHNSLLENSDIINKKIETTGIRSNNSEFPLDATIVPFKTQNQWNLVITLRDVTEEKRQKDELKAAKEKAEISDKLKSAFLANMSHEIRTPMNSIIGFADLLQKPKLSDEQRTKFLEYIQRSSKSLMNLINDIIDISKIEAGQLKIKKEETNINQILDETYDAFRSIKIIEDKPVTTTLNLTKEVINGEVIVKTDPYRARQIFNNLLSNALKFTDKGYVEFGYKTKDKEIIFFVKDTGIGIPFDKQEIIFEQFGQVEETYSRNKGGTGLGLAISKKLVHLMGGKIWVESEEGVGSTFYFTLPFENTNHFKVVIDENSEITPEEYSWAGKEILVVEDEDMNYLFIEEALSPYNVKLDWASNGKIAIEKVQEKHFDLILMDIKMPVMDGNEATQKIKQIFPEIPIVAQTAYAMQDEQQKAIDAGCDGYLSKPLKINLLLATMNQFLKS